MNTRLYFAAVTLVLCAGCASDYEIKKIACLDSLAQKPEVGPVKHQLLVTDGRAQASIRDITGYSYSEERVCVAVQEDIRRLPYDYAARTCGYFLCSPFTYYRDKP